MESDKGYKEIGDMKVLNMDWWDDFSCIGGECPLTCCCTSWSIDLTEKEIEQYEKLDHPFRDTIVASIDKGNKKMKEKNGYCSLLTEDGWCHMVRECGEQYLSNTCTEFPRNRRIFGDIVEQTVELVCPVVAKYLFRKEKIVFDFGETDVKEAINSIDYTLYDTLSLVRTNLIDLFQEYKGNFFTGKMIIMLQLLYKIKKLFANNTFSRENVEELLAFYENETNRATIFFKGEEIAKNYKEKVKVLCKFMIWLDKWVTTLMEKKLMETDFGLKQNIKLWSKNPESFVCDLQVFSEYFRTKYGQVFENYFVYTLFHDWISLEKDKFGKNIILKVFEFAQIQLLALSIWKEKGGVLPQSDYELMITYSDRSIGHSSEKEAFYKSMQENDFTCTASLLMLCII